MKNIFEQALREKLRFETPKGLVTTEDLYDLPLTGSSANLDDIAKALYAKLNTSDVKSFVVKVEAEAVDRITQLKFDIVTHVINTRLAELETAKNAAARKIEKEKLLAIIAEKEHEQIKSTDLDALRKKVAEL